ncbi:MAG: NADP-dependent isocitrate dehydrogenase [Phycisphaerales bacterium]|nr:NADP-dependent isocitrate dehydrogenase [Phycisphaerales bacterium]
MSHASVTHNVTVMPGDGVGSECVAAVRRIIAAAGVSIAWEECEAGGVVFRKGISSGVPRETIDSIARTRVALKGPLETPVGYGERSANVTLRKLFELYGNIRPTRELPGVQAPFAGRQVDFVVVRENVEDLYAGIEHMQTPGVAQCLKLMSRKGCEKVIRLAFEMARAEGRHRVHCATKSNIMKLTEGLMKRTFEEVAREYPDLQSEHIIIDNCAHQMVRYPEQFDVIVTSNLNGDIISDLAAGLVGGLGLAPSANIGNDVAMFEAVHGSAPTIAGKNIVNPTALLLSAVMMLRHLGEFEAAATIENSVIFTIELGKTLTPDLTDPDHAASTTQFTDKVIEHFGRKSDHWKARHYHALNPPRVSPRSDYVQVKSRSIAGVDIFVESPLDAGALGESVTALLADSPLRLTSISNRGAVVYPSSDARVDCVDHWRCRLMPRGNTREATDAQIAEALARIATKHAWVHIEKLQAFDGVNAWAADAGE